VWFDDEPVDFSRITLTRAVEVVCHRQLRSGLEATITREGLVVFKFVGTAMDAGPVDTSAMTADQHTTLTRIIHARAEVLTFHSACLAMARGEATNSVGHGATNVIPTVMIHCDENMQNPASPDRGIMGCLIARAQSKGPAHLALALQRNETLEWVDPTAATRSLELFDQFYDPRRIRLRRAVYTLVNAVDHLSRNEYAQAFILAWTVIEHCVARRWDRALEDRAHGRLPEAAAQFIAAEEARQAKKASEFPVAARIAALTLIDPGAGYYSRAEALRVLRNNFIHDLEQVSPDNGSASAQVALELMKAHYRMDLRLGTGYGYML
jgi:hypothetical protein